MKPTLPLAVLLSMLLLGTARAEDRPNVVFFLADDQTASSLGCYGNAVARTPNIDSLAASGVRFDNAFVSHSICWVSRTTLLSGLTGRGYGTPGNQELARPEAVDELVSDTLRQAGYRTGFFGKWDARMPQGYKPQEHFDAYEAIGRNPYYKVQSDGSLRHETDLVVDRGIEFLKSQSKDQPFALNLWFNACHAEDSDRRPGVGHFPWPSSADGMYDDTEMPPPRLNDPAIFEALPDFLQTTINRERYFWRWNTPHKYQLNMRAYYRMTSGIDAAIGRFMQELDAAGLADNTVVVYSADNGYYMGNRGLAGKWSHFDDSLRVPLIVADPRLPAEQRGKVSEAAALNVDLPATFLDWAGVEVPPRYQGRSLRPLVEGETPGEWREETFHEHFAVRSRIPAWEGVRTDRFKYARYLGHGGYEFLHDLRADPDELVNLAGDAQHAGALEEMRRRADALVAEHGQPLTPLEGPFVASTVPHPEAAAMVGAKADAGGWVSLFDGRSLKGWAGDAKYWSVEDGAITGKADGTLKRNHFLSWKDSTVRNFELRVAVRVSAGGNSGIQYRGLMRPDIGLDAVSGYQCDVVPGNAGYDGMLYEERGRRILAHAGERAIVDASGQPWVVGKLDVPRFEPDRWHEYRVLVRGNHHQHWIDGHQTVDVVDLDEAGRALEGVLAVQVHVGPTMKIQYKDFSIKHLPDDLPLERAEDHLIPAGAVKVKPQG